MIGNSFTDIGIYALKLLSSTVLYLRLDVIRRDGGTQPRAAINLEHVKRLGLQIENGQGLEPVIVFYDGKSYWLADGYHRFAAYRHQEKEAIACIVHQGTLRDAVLYSVGANAQNKLALPRSYQDKHRAVMTLLQDSEWGKWSDFTIARTCKVSCITVKKIRSYLCGKFPIDEKHKTTLTPPDPSRFLTAMRDYHAVIHDYYKALYCLYIPDPKRFLAAARDYHVVVSKYYRELNYYYQSNIEIAAKLVEKDFCSSAAPSLAREQAWPSTKLQESSKFKPSSPNGE